LDQIIPSPVTTGYRNKCEFTIGRGPDNDDAKLEIGFALNRFRDLGRTVVVPVDNCKLVPDTVKNVIRRFRDFVLPKCGKPASDGVVFYRYFSNLYTGIVVDVTSEGVLAFIDSEILQIGPDAHCYSKRLSRNGK